MACPREPSSHGKRGRFGGTISPGVSLPRWSHGIQLSLCSRDLLLTPWADVPYVQTATKKITEPPPFKPCSASQPIGSRTCPHAFYPFRKLLEWHMCFSISHPRRKTKLATTPASRPLFASSVSRRRIHLGLLSLCASCAHIPAIGTRLVVSCTEEGQRHRRMVEARVVKP